MSLIPIFNQSINKKNNNQTTNEREYVTYTNDDARRAQEAKKAQEIQKAEEDRNRLLEKRKKDKLQENKQKNKGKTTHFQSTAKNITPANTYCAENTTTFELKADDFVMTSFCVYRNHTGPGAFSGMFSEYYANGTLKYTMKYKKGKYNGKWIHYYNQDGGFLCRIKYNKLTRTTKVKYFL